jgi:hypothetical protein
MAKVKEVLRHVSVQTAGAKRKCHRKPMQHSIAKGEQCLVIKDVSSGSSRNYCPECAEPILDRAQKDLSRFRTELQL